jgi:hypothetical protein
VISRMDTSSATEITFRALAPEEHERFDLKLIFATHGAEVPPPELSTVVVGEDGQGHLHFVCAPTSFVAVDRLWVMESDRGSGLWRAGCEAVERELRNRGVPAYFVFAPDPKIEHCAREFGMEEMPFRVFRKVLREGT